MDTCGSKVYRFSLICSEEALQQRLGNEVANGIRESDIIARSLSRLSNYLEMDTEKIDTTEITAKEAAEVIHKIIYPKRWNTTDRSSIPLQNEGEGE